MARILVTIPTYNEEKNIGQLLEQATAQRAKIPNDQLDLLISDSSSPDETQKIVNRFSQQTPGIFLINSPKEGVGAGLIKGFDYAVKNNYQILMQMDADFSHDPNDIPRLLKEINANYDLANASRYAPGGQIKAWTADRRILSASANLLVRLFSGIWEIHEFTTNFRAFKTEVYQKLRPALTNFKDNTFLVAFLHQAHRAGFRIKEVPITFTDRRAGESKVRVGEYTPSLLKYLAKTRLGLV